MKSELVVLVFVPQEEEVSAAKTSFQLGKGKPEGRILTPSVRVPDSWCEASAHGPVHSKRLFNEGVSDKTRSPESPAAPACTHLQPATCSTLPANVKAKTGLSPTGYILLDCEMQTNNIFTPSPGDTASPFKKGETIVTDPLIG